MDTPCSRANGGLGHPLAGLVQDFHASKACMRSAPNLRCTFAKPRVACGQQRTEALALVLGRRAEYQLKTGLGTRFNKWPCKDGTCCYGSCKRV